MAIDYVGGLVGARHVCYFGGAARSIVSQERNSLFIAKAFHSPISTTVDLLRLRLFHVMARRRRYIAILDICVSTWPAHFSISQRMAHIGTVVPAGLLVGAHRFANTFLRCKKNRRHCTNHWLPHGYRTRVVFIRYF